MAIRQRRIQKKGKKNASATNSSKSKNKKYLDTWNENDHNTSKTSNWKRQSIAVVILLLVIGYYCYYYVMFPVDIENEEMMVVENEVENSQSREEIIASNNGNSNDGNPKSARIKDTLILGEDSYKVLEILNHDRKAFTQGLTWHNGFLYEGTGLHGSSELRKLDPSNPSTALMTHTMSSKYFGEGITFYTDKQGNERILQITWREKTAFVYDANTFEVIKEFLYDTSNGEGWGITFIPQTCEFVVSDGSYHLMFWDCETFVEKRRVVVNYYQESKASPVKLLNELEIMKIGGGDDDDDDNYVILANVWYQDVLLQINPSNGDIEKVYYFNDLHKDRESDEDVFNGISVCDENERTIYLTGKLWSKIYKVELLK